MIRYKGFILFLLLMLIGCEQREELISNLSQRQANEIISVLERHNITARKVDGGK
ncbi:EscJ/YscJ/HrcJ family type III secretion inner membrane ring protein, partial [Shigella sonnei]|nr:EscJ/YscJ/HrcJ family type III secretion inner membrane ring protein [Shigella sonnei]